MVFYKKLFISIGFFFSLIGEDFFVVPRIESIKQVAHLFPHTVVEIQKNTQNVMKQAREGLAIIYALSPVHRTFDNTIRALDSLIGEFSVFATVCSVLELVHPDHVIRESAHTASVTLHNFSVDHFSQNKKLYESVMAYIENTNLHDLNSEERYTIEETVKEFKRAGLHLGDEIQHELKVLYKALGKHTLNFEKNIATDNRTISVMPESLTGLSEEFMAHLSHNADGTRNIGVDAPTYSYVMQNCVVESTRKSLWLAYFNRAFPQNDKELSQIILLRDQIAQLSGFGSFADLDISNQMAKEPKTVIDFLNNLIDRCKSKVNQEIADFKKDLPPSVTLTEDNKFKPWDLLFVRDHYKKKNYDVNEVEISEYFPLDSTLQGLFAIYQKFFGITLKPEKNVKLWHPEVQALAVYKNNKFIGYILLDIFPRPNKYTHACEVTIVPTFKQATYYPALILVIANFPRPVGEKPALLLRQDVITFFHEFGHAIHAILGTTELMANSGASVKRDFVEMPSQMLEEWMWQPEILKQISCHYITKKPLSDELIAKILRLKNFNSGEQLQRQLYLSFLSLNCYTKGAIKNIEQLSKALFEQIITHVAFQPEDHLYASFGHLTGYASKYYGYLWSKVFALDLFEKIKQAGFSQEIADKYINTIISKGGSADPQELLCNFLNREPNSDAFFKDFGI